MIDWPGMWNDEDRSRRPSLIRGLLWGLSRLYRPVTLLRNRLYDRGVLASVSLARPVISVGNLTVGGTGKTPCVIYITRLLQKKGYRPAVISRGYGGSGTGAVNIVSDGQDVLLDAVAAGDEPVLMAQALPGVPVITGPKRVATGQAAIDRFNADVIVCDDAFQHRQMARDINLVLLDDRRPLGNGHLLPRGELREDPASLCRADALVMTRADAGQPLHPEIAAWSQQYRIPVFRSIHHPRDLIRGDATQTLGLEHLHGRRIGAFCGIAKPDTFKDTLTSLGAELLSFNPFPDHFAFTSRDLDDLEAVVREQSLDYLITTEKDAMRLARCPAFLNMIWALRMTMEFPDATAFETWLLKRLNDAQNAKRSGSAV